MFADSDCADARGIAAHARIFPSLSHCLPAGVSATRRARTLAAQAIDGRSRGICGTFNCSQRYFVLAYARGLARSGPLCAGATAAFTVQSGSDSVLLRALGKNS